MSLTTEHKISERDEKVLTAIKVNLEIWFNNKEKYETIINDFELTLCKAYVINKQFTFAPYRNKNIDIVLSAFDNSISNINNYDVLEQWFNAYYQKITG